RLRAQSRTGFYSLEAVPRTTGFPANCGGGAEPLARAADGNPGSAGNPVQSSGGAGIGAVWRISVCAGRSGAQHAAGDCRYSESNVCAEPDEPGPGRTFFELHGK